MKKHQLAWDNKCHSIGISVIDDQHCEIMRLVNHIAEMTVQGCQSRNLAGLFDDLLAFSREHFMVEEQFMREYGFLDSENHIMEHAAHIERMSNLIEACRASPHPRKAALLSAFLIDWVEQHILQEDRELGRFLVAKGLK